ncbi:beta-galactosidase [Aestuariicoccus sp. MJ-SS9]|uniref:beta-galactosidase n=1 Tax=Aestuariicoccus sp. MJ-SS9 TaxID=3079855 RepID=UPI002909F938|nr:beta-galactosidase [Aestuariicoccus sp. MJ-SS9]MDU8910636.1 beta-galactosidase [Aestuariicoccus sp. MJ-SS9]
MKRTLGCCYYPEHWPREIWEQDAARMADLGLTWVRIGEFAWSRLEPEPGKLEFGWLDDAIEVLGRAGLKVVLGTPTATPPRWVLDKHPDMLAVDAQGRPRKFGSRRHYCFSHQGYLAECRRIVTLLAERYGDNPNVAAWQTDNEYGCHDTVISYSEAALAAFQDWLRAQFPAANGGDIGALNAAWGNVFWSMDYRDFSEIDLPNLTVTEPNPAHALAFRRFSSDQVAAFNRAQVEILRRYSDAPIAHNYMGRVTEFDHFATGADLDIASWDSYPLGFLEDRVGADAARQRRYARQGDPDFQAFHHDLYRAVAAVAPGSGSEAVAQSYPRSSSEAVAQYPRLWVMEQQPGPVNWAPYNPSPLPGMVRLWTWEAFAHGAEAVLYFRWRQAPFAQEQLHAGLLRPDSVAAPGFDEAAEVARELAEAPDIAPCQAPVALIFDYAACWSWEVQPQGQGLAYFDLVFDHYRALRRLGLSVDILAPTARDFSGYGLILAPGMMHMPDGLIAALQASGTEVLIGPRSAARDAHFTIPVPLPPAWPGLDVTVSRLQTLRPDMPVPLAGGGAVRNWLEEIEGSAEVVLRTEDGAPVAMREGPVTYMGGWGDDAALEALLGTLCNRAGVATRPLPEGVRLRRTGAELFWFNHNAHAVETEAGTLPAAGVLRERL